MNVLSLCDGMSCGQIALNELGVDIENYFAYEIKEFAIQTTQLNFPDTKQLGDVNSFDIKDIGNKKIDLFLCGSPCQNMSLINITQRTGIQGEKSSLFFKCVEILEQVKPKYFLFENVNSMKNADKQIITKLLGVDPISINSALVSAQTRNRLYWTNIPNVTQPPDKFIFLSSILDKNPKLEEKWSDKKLEFVKKKSNSMYVRINGDKAITVTARGYSAWNTQFIKDKNGVLRDLTINEYRKLQTIPDWYCFGDLSKSKITNLLGDGWTVDVIKHIFKNIDIK